jgi:ABC-type transport system involved in cytochrome c biogenesis ATPase subunit/predicted  nucleic acid-binding Zn-ribbon protein
MAWIERIEVEDGFLDGLDLELSPRLNVVIGARGTGKTSLLELIRFALGAPAFTEQAAALSEAQVRAVLGRGRVTLTIRNDDGSSQAVTRTASAAAAPILQATVLAQNEIEAVGASATGRLHLLDRFMAAPSERLDGLRREISAVGRVADSLTEEITALRQRLDALPTLEQQLAALQDAQNAAFERSSASEAERQRLAELQANLQGISQREQLLAQAMDAVEARRALLAEAVHRGGMPSWPDEAGTDPTSTARAAYDQSSAALSAAETQLAAAAAELANALGADRAVRETSENEARQLRRQLGAVDAEVSSLSNQIAEINEQIGSLRALEELAVDHGRRLDEATERRLSLYDELDDLRQQRFQSRREVADRLNAELGPAISVELVQSAEVDDYVNEIVTRLRGSGLHSSTLAPELASSLDPHDLVRLVEKDAFSEVATLTGLAASRVRSAFDRLRTTSLSGLAAVRIDDAVELFLLDNATRKSSGELSIGQRCTAVLPVLLQRHGDVLVIDQPEDHLDNAFVTSTLVESLRHRSEGEQVILASHNANVPVLGEADLVVHMASDGHRGFVLHAAPLDDPGTVKSVTDVMEGGAEAFQRRAAFYERHGHGST